jgi:two-component system, NarL family, nitrate/nitrite response regulator NarL
MRLLICDYHVVFAESLAHLLTARGKDVVAVTHHPDELIDVLRREPVDVCLLDIRFGRENAIDRLAELRRASPATRVVLLTAEVDQAVLAAGRAAGVRGVADKRQPASDIIDLLDRVHAGESVLPQDGACEPLTPGVPRRPANDVQRLAEFLTPREREVLSALVRGDDTKKLARSLGIAAATARCHIQNVLTKLGAHSRLEAATSAVRYGMVSPETGDWLVPGNGRGPGPSPAFGMGDPRSFLLGGQPGLPVNGRDHR